jgi:hypothetical protein
MNKAFAVKDLRSQTPTRGQKNCPTTDLVLAWLSSSQVLFYQAFIFSNFVRFFPGLSGTSSRIRPGSGLQTIFPERVTLSRSVPTESLVVRDRGTEVRKFCNFLGP